MRLSRGINYRWLVYIHRRKDDKMPFYVGLGVYWASVKMEKLRPYDFVKRNSFWRNIANAHGVEVELVCIDTDLNTAIDTEKELIAKYKRVCDGGTLTNVSLGGETPYPMTAEAIEKMNKKLIGLKRSPDTCQRISYARKGMKFSDEVRKNISEGTKRAMDNPEVKEKVGSAMRGKHHTEETKQKQSEHAKEHVDKYHSDKQRRASSEALKRYWAKRKEEKK